MILNCNGKILNLSSPKVMGVININKDSFYSKSRVQNINDLIVKAEQFITQGVDIIDIGVMSSRPGATMISHEDEWTILYEYIDELIKLNTLISIDTVWSNTATKAAEKGCNIINDISGGTIDKDMFLHVGKSSVGYVMMHMRGTPENMQTMTQYDDLILDIISFFKNQIHQAKTNGIKDIVIDPGFGFAKSLDQNYMLLNKLSSFKLFDCPILVGLSRKSMLYRYLEITPEDALNATSVVNTYAILNGANILRVHDIVEAKQVVLLMNKLHSFS
jgi:dihydropteroate synthase